MADRTSVPQSVSLGEPPRRPSSAFAPSPPPRSGSSRGPPGPLPHPLIPPHVREGQGSPVGQPSGTRRVVTYDAATAKTISAQGYRSASITPVVSTSKSATYMSGAVSYYDLSHGSQESSYGSPSEFSPTAESFSFSSGESADVQSPGERYHPSIAYSYDDDPKVTSARNADPNAYLSSGYPGATDPHAPRAKEATAPAGSYDKSNVIITHDGPRSRKAFHHYAPAPSTPATPETRREERKRVEEPSILSRAMESAKEPFKLPEVAPEALARYANLPPKDGKGKHNVAHEMERDARPMINEPSILSLVAKAAKEPYKFPEVSPDVVAAFANMPPKEPPPKREYSKTRPGPAIYLGQGPQKEVVPVPEGGVPYRPGGEERASSRGSPSAPVNASATRRPTASATKGPSARARAAEAMRAAEEAARAQQARLDEARRRGYTPAVPIPGNLIFVDADGTVLPPPPRS